SDGTSLNNIRQRVFMCLSRLGTGILEQKNGFPSREAIFASKKRFPASGRPLWERKNGFLSREAIF
ncbi:MAG: hypothetical protein II261_02495, partial [Bacteroidaceae bacterium]|nr:hypothetical protein [Bacteroidaceae bacterium]